MTTLVTGANGKVGKYFTGILQNSKKPFVVAARTQQGATSGPYKTVLFDWYNPSTFNNPFEAEPTIDKLYLVAPPGSTDSLTAVAPFLDLAVSKGVKRIVFVSASQVEEGGPALGKIHEYLRKLDVHFTVLRPTWFIENLASAHLQTIKNENTIYSHVGDGRVPFIGAKDIAQAAFDALYDENAKSGRQPRILGPELLTHDEVAAILTEVLGRKITHKNLGPDEIAQAWIDAGVPEGFQKALAYMELQAGKGSEEAYFTGSEDKIIGSATTKEFVLANKEIWSP